MGSLVCRCGILGEDDGLDISTDREVSDYTHPARREQGDQIVEDHVGRRFVTDLPIAVGVDVKLQTLQLHDLLARHVVNGNGGKIREARPGTEASELWDLQMHD